MLNRAMLQRITFNGVTYDSPEVMPPEARAAYERAMEALADRDGDGVPDVIEQSGAMGRDAAVVTRHTSQITVNDKTYSNPDDMPPNIRRLYEEMRKAMPGDGPNAGTGELLIKDVRTTDITPQIGRGAVQSGARLGRVQPLSQLNTHDNYSDASRRGWIMLLTGIAIGAFVMLALLWLLSKSSL